jgi:hypothetical protein
MHPRAAEKKGIAWAKTLPEYMMLLQERTASARAARVLGRRYLRVNYTDSSVAAFLDLDVTDDRPLSRCWTRPRRRLLRRTGIIGFPSIACSTTPLPSCPSRKPVRAPLDRTAVHAGSRC